MNTEHSSIFGEKFPFYEENIPEELKHGRQWVNCLHNKKPIIPTQNARILAASHSEPKTWREYERAVFAYQTFTYAKGTGRVFTEDEPYYGIDLDDVIHPETGKIDPWASRIISLLASYSEVSPSGTGVKITVKAPEVTRSYKKAGCEFYASYRYFTYTGQIIRHQGDAGDWQIAERSAEVLQLIEEEFPRRERSAGTYFGPERDVDLEGMLERANIDILGYVKTERSARDAYTIRCPWYEEHTGGDISGTRAGVYENGATFFKCEHSHCAHRKWEDFKHWLRCVIHLGRAPRINARGI